MRSASGPGGLILGIESSCDETAAAVVRGGRTVLSNVVASQIALHAQYGGVVPELASREHLRNIVPVVRAAMAQAALAQPGLGFADLDAIAVTEGPGLAGALLVGITYAKSLTLGLGKPLVGVNHLEGHIWSVLMGADSQNAAMELPVLALVVSGGHTHLYLAERPQDPTEVCATSRNHEDETVVNEAPNAGAWRYRNVGRTVDDAAGEAFDKVAKLLGLGYPGGPWLDALAPLGDPKAVEFKFGEIKRRTTMQLPLDEGQRRFPSGMTNRMVSLPQHFDFSFSGIKTAVLRYVQSHGLAEQVEARRRALAAMTGAGNPVTPADALDRAPELFDGQTLDLIASFQAAVVGNLLRQTLRAAEALGARALVVSGGVAANRELRRRFAEEAARRGLGIAFPASGLATDNAAMIAAAAWGKFCAGDLAGEGLVAVPGLKLG